MKRFSLVAGLLCFLFVACCSKADEPKQEEVAEKACEKKEKCYKNMTEEEKAACKEFFEKWKDFDNQTEEVQKELIAKKKACFDKKIAEKEAKLEACKAEWANFDNLSLEDQKALIDKKMQCKKGKGSCKKGGEGKKCHKAEGEKAKCNKK